MGELPIRKSREGTKEPPRLGITTYETEHVVSTVHVERRATMGAIRKENNSAGQPSPERAFLFRFEIAMTVVVAAVVMVVLLGDYAWQLKTGAFAILGFIVRAFVKHLTSSS